MATRLEFRILGPLTVRVDGAATPIGGPKQRALLALLLLSANRVVARDRLIAELFADQSVNSADHALRNHVSRLRKALAPAAADEPRLVARAPGYLLRVEPGELDLEHFERLAAAGREALAAGDAAAAATCLRAAERLWEGRPLADLELEPFARVEVERLEELRLAAVEERIDAELVLGRQLALVPELEALGAEHPYRERFRAQLMLALYRSGRQAEGLEVYRRTRTLLSEELGLEPSVELQELERAILVQDPALTVATDGREVAALPEWDVCPFKGLAPFDRDDVELFFGRERLVDELVARVADAPLLAIVGPSGSGKSSLLRAGLLPALAAPSIVLRPGDGPPSLPPSGARVVVAVDQFEELFAPTIAEDERRAFVDALVDAAWDPGRRAIVLLALRADFFGRLAPYVELADLVGPNHVLLGPMSVSELRRAVEGPAGRAGLEVEPALVDALIGDVAGEAGGLPLLSTALVDLWRERDGRRLTLAAYERTGGVRGAVGRYAESAYRSLRDGDRAVAGRVLLRLVAGGDGVALTRRRASRAELELDDDAAVARVVEALVERRLLIADGGTVELVHEALLEQWPRLREWVEEDAQGARLHRHLADAAAEWDAGGRDSGELYRGARLAAALEWLDTTDDARLNRLEREFVDESRAAHARATRRLRTLLALAVLLLAAAVAAGAVALRARGTARRQATTAIAQRLGAQALVEPRLDRALLLAREGVNLDDSAATRGNLLAALLKSPAAIAVLHGGGGARVLDDALSRDGRVLAERKDDGSVTLFDTATLRRLGGFEGRGQIGYFGAVVRPFRALAFSPDGRTLAVGDSDGYHATIALVDVRSGRKRASAVDRPNGVTADVVFAPDGRTLVTGEPVNGRDQPPAEVLVRRSAADAHELRRSRRIAGGRLIGYALGGRALLETSGETRSYLLDPRTFARVRTIPVSGAAALAPGGAVGAFGQDDGTVELVDLRTGVVRPMDRRATGRVRGIAFGADGKTLATTSDDGSVAVWDVPTRTLRETYKGHSAAALGPVFSPDGATLYTGSDDGSIIVWDVRGRRRLGQTFRYAPPRYGNTAIAVSPDGSMFATSPGPDRVTLRRTRDQRVVAVLKGPIGGAQSLAWSHDGRLLAGEGSGSRFTPVWNVATRRLVEALRAPDKGGGAGVSFSPDDRLVATAGGDGFMRVFDLRSGRVVASLDVKKRSSLQDVDFSSDGTRVAAAGLGGIVGVWNLARHRLERRIRHGPAFLAIRFSPDGKEIATGDFLGQVDFWDPATGKEVRRPIRGENGLVLSVTYSPSGAQLLTTSTDGTVRLWDLATEKLIGAPLPGSDAGGWGTFFHDGKHVVAVFFSGNAVIWNVDPAAWEEHACRVAHRELTRDEWHDFLPERPYRRVCD